MVEEQAVHRAAHRLVAAEGEAEVRQAPADVRPRTAAANFGRRLDKVERIAAMLVDTCRNREDVRVENDIVGLSAVGDEQVVRALADRDLSLRRIRLSDL